MTAAGEIGATPGPGGVDGALSALRQLLENAAAGRFPPADGGTQVIPAPDGPVHAVLAFTGHHVIAAAIDPAEVMTRLDPDDIAAPMGAPFLAWLGGRLGAMPGTLDVVLAARAGSSAPPFPQSCGNTGSPCLAVPHECCGKKPPAGSAGNRPACIWACNNK